MRVHPSKNMSFKIVYRREFDRIDTSGKLICRNNKCENLVKYPFKKYCSKNCNIEFEKWYYDNFYWRRVRNINIGVDTETEALHHWNVTT